MTQPKPEDIARQIVEACAFSRSVKPITWTDDLYENVLLAIREAEAPLRAEIELHEIHWTEARDERNKIRAWLCDKGLDAEYGETCDVPGCPKAWEAENEALRARIEKLEASLGWAIGWVAEEIEPCKLRNEGCPWDKDHDQLDEARALLAIVEPTS